MALIAALKSLSQQLGVYNHLRYSDFYYWLLKYKNPQYINDLNSDLAFYRAAVGTSLGLVFDVGANHGDKSWVFKQIASRVVCVEPDRSCHPALVARFGRDKRISLENVALGDKVGDVTFYVEGEGSAYNTLSEKQRDWLLSNRTQGGLGEYTVPVSTLDVLIEKYGVPDYLKIDVEGYELPVLNGLSHLVHVVSFEANLPRFLPETFRIIERFAQQGSARFNLRLADRFIFSSHQSRESIEEVLRSEEEVPYDVFVYNGD